MPPHFGVVFLNGFRKFLAPFIQSRDFCFIARILAELRQTFSELIKRREKLSFDGLDFPLVARSFQWVLTRVET